MNSQELSVISGFRQEADESWGSSGLLRRM